MAVVEYDVMDVAQWFVKRAFLDLRDGRGECISLSKLQKLLYFAQGCYGATESKKLFKDDIVHDKSGPVVLKVQDRYKYFGNNGISLIDADSQIDATIVPYLQNIYLLFGQYSTWRLSEMTSNELPWTMTKQDDIITFDAMTKYFKMYHEDRLNTLRIRDQRVLERANNLRDKGILDDDFIIKNFYKYY